jgi:rod shape-determining protein MreD
MKAKVFAYAVCIFFIVLIQTTLLDYIRIYNIKPNLLIIFTISVALLTNNIEGAVIGFFTGLSQDVASGKVLGLYSLLGMYMGLIVGSVNKRLYRENFFVVIFFTFISTIVYECTVYAVNFFTIGQNAFVHLLTRLILPEAAYNSIASVFIYVFVFKLRERFEYADKFNRKY